MNNRAIFRTIRLYVWTEVAGFAVVGVISVDGVKLMLEPLSAVGLPCSEHLGQNRFCESMLKPRVQRL